MPIAVATGSIIRNMHCVYNSKFKICMLSLLNLLSLINN